MGQQKIYVDIEEEITTVIEQLRHTRTQDVVLVVPQHALLLQSVVNLKLLSQEARRMQKNVSVMTKDVDGAAFAERAGIVTQPYVAEEEVLQEQFTEQSQVLQKQQGVFAPHEQKKDVTTFQKQPVHNNLRPSVQKQVVREGDIRESEGVNKNSGFGGDIMPPQQKRVVQRASKKRAVNNVVEDPIENGIEQYEKSLDQMRVESSQSVASSAQLYQEEQRRLGTTIHPTQQKDSFSQYAGMQHGMPASRAPQKNKRPKNSRKKVSSKKQKKAVSQVSGGMNIAMRGFIFAGIVLIFIVAFVIVLPKTSISITPKMVDMNEEMEMTVRTDQSVYDEDRRLIPARFVERDVTFTKTFPSTGTGDVEAQKSQGTITIYNEYSEKSQSLVATTRFLAEDGTLFRLAKQATVPGMKNGEAGKVDALVIADEEGAGGNIGPTRFSIPGFAGGPKKDKFYAVSEKSMTGGGSGGDGVAVVTEEDIKKAEEVMNNEVSGYVEEQLRAVLRPDSEVLLIDAVENEILRSEASVSAGTMGEDFMYEIASHVKAIVFAEGDMMAVMQSGVDADMRQYDVDQMEMVLNYEVVEVDFESEQIKINVLGTANFVAVVDSAAFKDDILGKKHDDLLAVIEDGYSDTIEKITIDSVLPGFPAFVANRISRIGLMTDLSIAQKEE